MQPFHLLNNPPAENGEDTNDLSADGTSNGPVTMGYFNRSELAFYYALADAFTVCDNYFCRCSARPTRTG